MDSHYVHMQKECCICLIYESESQEKIINLNKGNRFKKTVAFASPVGFPWKGEYLYYIKIKEDKGFIPNKLDSRTKDNRFLGVFIQTEVN